MRFCALFDSWIAKCPCSFNLCHLFRCFDPRFKENIHCHPAFIISDINSCRKDYWKRRLKSRESDYFNLTIRLLLNAITKHSTILRFSNKDVEKSAVTSSWYDNYVMYSDTNCSAYYYMGESVLLGTKPLVDSIRHFIRDPSGVFSVCHLCECRIVQWRHDSRLLLLFNI